MKLDVDDSFDSLMKEVQSSYPFPLAFAFQETVLNAASDEARVRGIIHVFTVAIQYIAMICASEYSRVGFADEHLSWSLESLKRPLVSSFLNFLASTVSSFEEQGITPLVTELPEFARTLEQKRVTTTIVVDDTLVEKSVLLRKALTELRNYLAHVALKGDWKALLQEYQPLLIEFLRNMAWCSRYPLLRIVDDDRMIRLMGASTEYVAEPVPASARIVIKMAIDSGQFGGLLLSNPALASFLNLYPLVILDQCDDCKAGAIPGTTEEMFLFNGDMGKFLVYLSAKGHGKKTNAPRASIEELYERKKVTPPVVEVKRVHIPELQYRAKRQSVEMVLENTEAGRYFPDVTFPRIEIEKSISLFLRSVKVGFLLLGESGIGKTSLLCRLVELLSGRLADPSDSMASAENVVMFFRGEGLFAQGNLEDRILNELFLKGGLGEMLNTLRKGGRQLVLLIDGVNEDPDPTRSLNALCDFIKNYSRSPDGGRSLKVIFTFRSTYFSKTLNALGYSGNGDEVASLFTSDAFYAREEESSGVPVETYRFFLERLTEEEAGVMYEAYRSLAKESESEDNSFRFRPLTPFELLSPRVRRYLANPWYMRMAMESFHGREIPADLWISTLLEEYSLRKIYGKTEEDQCRHVGRSMFTDNIVALMRKMKTDTIALADLELSPPLKDTIFKLRLADSPYPNLLDEGVLMETSRQIKIGAIKRTEFQVRFTFDALFEYLLSVDIQREAGGFDHLDAEILASLLAEGVSFDHMIGAVDLILCEAAREQTYQLIIDTLNSADEEVGIPALVRLLVSIDETEETALEPLLDAISSSPANDKALAVLTEAPGAFLERRRWQPMLLSAKKAERLARKLVESGVGEYRRELAAALANRGLALLGSGHIDGAIDLLQAAVASYLELVETRSELLPELAMAFLNAGTAHSQRREFADAVDMLEHAISVYTDISGKQDVSSALAAALENKGLALFDLDRLQEALDCIDRALAIRSRLVNDEGKRAFSGLLARSLSNKGMILDSLGRYEEALECYDSAASEYRHFQEEEDSSEIAPELSALLVNKGAALLGLGRKEEALEIYENAVAKYRQMVEQGSREDLTFLLARSILNRGITREALGERQEALDDFEAAAELYEELIKRHGQYQLQGELDTAIARARQARTD